MLTNRYKVYNNGYDCRFAQSFKIDFLFIFDFEHTREYLINKHITLNCHKSHMH